MFKLVPMPKRSDVAAFGIRKLADEVQVEVYDADSGDDGRCLITARLSHDHAVQLAHALLLAAGVRGTPQAQGFTSFSLPKL